jgi:hypothetical protein
MGGCVDAAVHRAHLAAGDPRCDNENPPRLSVKDTAAAVRRALRTAWPKVKFSVTMSRGTGYGYLDATWTDGPTTADFYALVDGFRDMTFDGMDDSHRAVHRGTRYNCNGVSGQRRYSEDARQYAEAVIAAHPGLFDHAIHRVLAVTDLSDGIPTGTDHPEAHQ